MAILKIARMGHPVLRRQAEAIADPAAPEIARLIEDMQDTLADVDGLGLAAPQVHAPLRLVMFRIPHNEVDLDETGDDARDGVDDMPLRILINPVIEPLSDETDVGWEGCLSVPGLRGKVSRYTKIRYTGLTPDGTPLDVEAEGLHARVVQHECDHLDGVLYPMRMDDMSLLTFESEWKHFLPVHEADAFEEPEDELDPAS